MTLSHFKSISKLQHLFVVVVLTISSFSFSQAVSGPTTIPINSTQTYSYSDGLLHINRTWTITGGSQVSSWYTKNPFTLHISVQWGAGSSGQVKFNSTGATLNVNLIGGSGTSNPGGSSTAKCLNTTLSNNENYVHTLNPLKATANTSSLEVNEKIESVTYYDGLGRAKQSVGIRAGGRCQDIVTHIEYDTYGRMDKEYLPYAHTNNAGAYASGALLSTSSFYNTAKYENTPNPYSEKEFEASPLNRVFKQAAPGEDWQLGGGNEIVFDYQTNSSGEVKLYRATTAAQTASNVVTYQPSLQYAGNYGAGELYKTITRDENHTGNPTTVNDHTTEEFKNKQGQVVLKRTYNNEITHDTYYVYDSYGNLTFVLPPKVIHDSSISTTELNELCYQYKYDHRNRLVEKRIPGKGWEYIVYDTLDRPVLTQDANQKAKSPDEWLFTKYDVFGRVAYTGVFKDASNRSRQSLQNIFNAKSAAQNYETKLTSSGFSGSYYSNTHFPNTSIEVLTVNYYDNYTFNRSGGNSEVSYGITPITNVKSLATGSRVKVLDANQWITTVNYYDEKSRVIYTYSKNDYLQTTDKIKSNYTFDGRVLETTSTHAKTGQNSITTVDRFEYDHIGRLVEQNQKVNTNIPNRIARNQYDDLGQLESKLVGDGTQAGYKNMTYTSVSNDVITKTHNSSSWNADAVTKGSFSEDGYVEFTVLSTGKYYMTGLSTDNNTAGYSSIKYAVYFRATSDIYVYESGASRGKKTTYQVGDLFRVERIGETVYYKKNGETFYTSTVASTGTLFGDVSMFHYNAKIKNFKIVDNSKGLQTVDYTYNIRGWLKSINNPTSLGDDVFAFGINYNTPQQPGVTALYNGNISETKWRTANTDNSLKWYKYSYDDLNRIKSAYDNVGRYRLVNVNYDKNGNITFLQRGGAVNIAATSFNTSMDKLYYYYNTTSNKLRQVLDNGNDNFGFKDGYHSAFEYTYDSNGNMLRDLNKGITGITYNHLNLPAQVNIGSGNIKYNYDATGVKHKKIVSTGATTEYAGGYIYENTGSGLKLKMFSHPEGYVEPNNSGGFNYVYQYKDHLGNVRLTYADNNNDGQISASAEIIEENNYYPFGLEHKGYNNNHSAFRNSVASKFGFGGKELQDELGLDWYDVSARNYDPALGRWMNLDPLAEKMRRHSPYNFGFDNPVYFQDYDGMMPTGTNPIRRILKRLARAHKTTKAVKRANIYGRTGKQARLRELANDTKLGRADRGWLKNEMRHIKNGNRKTIRLPGNSRNSKKPGKVLAHERGREADKGFSYKHSNMQDNDLHKLQHKYDNNGKKNKMRPVENGAAIVAAGGSINSEIMSEKEMEVAKKAHKFYDAIENFGVNTFGDNDFGKMVDTFNPLSLGMSDFLGILVDNKDDKTKKTSNQKYSNKPIPLVEEF